MAAARVTTTPSQGEGGHGNGGGGHGNGGGGHGNGEGGHGNGDGGFSGEGPGPAQEERLCSHFVAITGCPQEAARAALQASAWALDRALDSYFEPPEDPRHTGGSPSPPAAPEVCVDLTDDSPTGASGSAHRGKREDDSTFSIICWNVDGLDPNNLSERARAVCSYLTLYSPAVVFLQEVIPAYYSYLKKRATNYTIIPGEYTGQRTLSSDLPPGEHQRLLHGASQPAENRLEEDAGDARVSDRHIWRRHQSQGLGGFQSRRPSRRHPGYLGVSGQARVLPLHVGHPGQLQPEDPQQVQIPLRPPVLPGGGPGRTRPPPQLGFARDGEAGLRPLPK
ncbi:tyrosyl-DNA phosphodiesterase 2 isoform X2 [Tachyglossus aculeatus]|uniref:tyrosyl-DNA phosphodiesterase 2 isoform X2 n=1 Tax=Tachyglossus aculeatus TaxID=9261 RepID=UPI0018F5F0B2|nr:tyrosyl-DNA phosphodiesterase 2 isoform X2 [Tachyglossus aculeatus]